MKNEIWEIPYRANLCYNKNKGIILPENVPYIGMGSSYIACTVFRYLGIELFPELASDYFNYLLKKEANKGVLISQSGKSSETLWCADHFNSFLSIVNDIDSPLANHKNCTSKINLYAGKEDTIPSKTFINSLLIMYLGFGFDPGKVVRVLNDEISFFNERGEELGELIYKRIKWNWKKGIYIIASGHNMATANQAALVLSQVTKLPVVSMSMSQYEHGFIETAQNTLVIAINHDGPDYKRTHNVLRVIRKAGGKTFELKKPLVETIYSPITFSVPFFFAANYLSEKLKNFNVFDVGKKVTHVPKNGIHT